MSDRILTIGEAKRLGQLIEATINYSHVYREIDNGRIVHGIARAIVDKNQNFVDSRMDVRDGYLWVTATFEYWWPISELLEEMASETFGIYE